MELGRDDSHIMPQHVKLRTMRLSYDSFSQRLLSGEQAPCFCLQEKRERAILITSQYPSVLFTISEK